MGTRLPTAPSEVLTSHFGQPANSVNPIPLPSNLADELICVQY